MQFSNLKMHHVQIFSELRHPAAETYIAPSDP